MKREGIINGELAQALATLRHTDLFVVSDAGFPVGRAGRVIDLAVVPGCPRLEDVLSPVLRAVCVEESWIASETATVNPERAALLASVLPDAMPVEHSRLKELADSAVFIVRTGDDTPYSNALISAGYPF